MRKTTLFLIIAVVGLLAVAASILVPFLSAQTAPAPSEPSSVAIIGGADGPTAVYVTSTLVKNLYLSHYLPITIVGGGVLILGIVGFAVSRSKKEHTGE